MKKRMTVFMTLACLWLNSSDANSGLLGDVDNDGKIGLTEAVYALQVAAGARSALPASYVIVWKGIWETGQDYQVYDAVQLGGSSYICLQSHTSDISKQPPNVPIWEPLALKGDTGPQGPKGDPGYDPTAVSITGGMIEGTPIGLMTPATGNFTTVSTKGIIVKDADGDSSLFINAKPAIQESIAIGIGSQESATTANAYRNTSLGDYSLYNNTTGIFNTAIGYGSLYSNLSSNNVGLGYYSLFSTTTGGDNIGIGFQSLFYNTAGVGMVAIGTQSLYHNTTAGNNIGIGYQSLYNNTNGWDNIGIGWRALYNNTSGVENYGIGYLSLAGMTTGQYNIGIGYMTLYANSTGGSNIAIGDHSLSESVDTSGNTAIGRYSGTVLETGNYNTFLGFTAGLHYLQKMDANNSMALGYGAYTTADNQVVLGNSSVTQTILRSPTIRGTSGGLVRKVYEASTASMSEASVTLILNIPKGARLLGAQLQLDTPVVSDDGATSWNAKFSGGSTTSIATSQSFTANNKVNTMLPGTEITTNTTNIIIAPNSNNFSGGVVRAIVYTEEFTE